MGRRARDAALRCRPRPTGQGAPSGGGRAGGSARRRRSRRIPLLDLLPAEPLVHGGRRHLQHARP
eukprot:4623535-Pleurochrysis_carterae.AAC.1